jgi:hypothetical protein
LHVRASVSAKIRIVAIHESNQPCSPNSQAEASAALRTDVSNSHADRYRAEALEPTTEREFPYAVGVPPACGLVPGLNASSVHGHSNRNRTVANCLPHRRD